MRFYRRALKLQLICSIISICVALGPGQVVHSSTVYDVIIVGGVSALARVRRGVLLVDSGHYRNDPTRYIHDLLGFDGVTPAYFRWKARQQIAYYETVSTTNGTVTNVDITDFSGQEESPSPTSNAPFVVHLTYPTGQEATVGARKIVLATGLRDILPTTPGIQRNWGKGIYWCPWCDGYEHADQPLGLLGKLALIPGLVEEIYTLNSDLIALVNGTDTPENRAAISQESPTWEQELAVYNVTLENRTIADIIRIQGSTSKISDTTPDTPTAAENDLFRVDFADGGPSIQRAVFFVSFPSEQHSNLGTDMGVRLDGNKLASDLATGCMTNLPGVYAIGDANADNSTNVPHALYT
ncbi:putative thioredoxin reductase [Xylariaceae sp. FL0255]|nr:putative thioredoxin reductase [Xylariaceae sp. FL0255]